MPQEQIRLHLQPGETTVGQVLDRIRRRSRDESEKGRWFEELVARVLKENPEYEVDRVHRWRDWPERSELTGLDGRDLGIDLVALRRDESWVAVQCKCYQGSHSVGKADIDSFLGFSGRAPFSQRRVVATSRWTDAAEEQIRGLEPSVSQIDFRRHVDDSISAEAVERPVQDPLPLQEKAIENVVNGLGNHERGRLIMPCGTGKTFTSLRIAERLVPDGGRILFLAPSIALVSQARREWLRHTTRPLTCRVVCSDRTAGGRGESEDIGVHELECKVTSEPAGIAAVLRGQEADYSPTRVVFSTYQSLEHITAAQFEFDAPGFDLAIMDEAHRTTGVDRKASGVEREGGFQNVHRADRLKTCKRLYMTATPRIYRESSHAKLKARGIETIAFANSIRRSRFFAAALKHPLVRRTTTTRLRHGRRETAAGAKKLESQHLDASNSALERNVALRRLKDATDDRVLQLLSNVKLFGEGVDVPALDAIVFMEPRDSQVDIVQAVGRVMRKSEETGKRFGYIVVPIPIEPGGDIARALAAGETGYQAVGKVLRALQAHDGRLAEEPLRFVQAYGTGTNGRGNGDGGAAEQVALDIEDVSPGLFAQVVAASGLGKPGLRTSQDIESVVKAAGRVLHDAELAEALAETLGIAGSEESGRVPVIAALLLANACLLHKRLTTAFCPRRRATAPSTRRTSPP